MTETRYTYRHIARLTVEAETPLAVSTGKASDILTDAPVAKDVNGLPYIPATSIAGVLRHTMGFADDKNEGNPFGYISKSDDNDDSGHGSDIIFTDAVMVGKDGKALDGIQNINWNDDFYRYFQDLPIRQHVRIDDKGTAENNGKFDNEVVYKGTRFVFEIELMSDKDDKEHITDAINRLYDCTLRIGGGTRKGYGKLKVVKYLQASLDLSTPEDLAKYLKKSSSLAEDWDGFAEDVEIKQSGHSGWTHYKLKLSPVDFFMFGSGMSDSEADNVYVSEPVINWSGIDGTPSFDGNRRVLIPGASVKGALAHRTAYHYNKNKGYFAGKQNPEEITGSNNKAVADIFGKADGNNLTRGRILIDDILKGQAQAKTFFHNKIDQFTGGTMDGALFQEKVVYGKGNEYTLNIYVEGNENSKDGALADEDVKTAFEQSLRDICTGLLPLGGITNRGNGIFTGVVTKNSEPLWEDQKK